MAKVGVEEVSKRCLEVMERVLKRKAESVISISKEAKGWGAIVEVLERRAVPDSQDLLGKYEVKLNEDGELIGYNQLGLRLRVQPYEISEYEEKAPAKSK